MDGLEDQPLLGPSAGHKRSPGLRDRHRTKLIATTVALMALFVVYLSWPSHYKPPDLPKYPAHVPFIGGPTWNPQTNLTARGSHGGVASDSALCSQLGVEILKKGGFAADAAVTTCLCIGATNTMFSAGIGGGAFITTRKHGEDGAVSIDAREMAPAKAHKDMFNGREVLSKFGGLAVGIPGELQGLYELHRLHGSGNVSWEELILPVVDILEGGFEVNELLGLALSAYKSYFHDYRHDWEFAFKDGRLLRAGEVMRRPQLAATLRQIAQNGSAAIFYDPHGPIAPHLARKVQRMGGVLQAEDFARYQAVVEPALVMNNFSRRALDIYTSSGASSGLALLSGLKIIDTFEPAKDKDFSVRESHRLVETMKWLASVRSNLGDVGVLSDNKTAREFRDARYSRLASEEWCGATARKINDNRTLPWQAYEPAYQPNEPHGTSHLSVVDRYHNAVSLTTTVNLLFGSLVHDPVTGIILNDEMDDFSIPTSKNAFGLQPSVYNYIEPFKRPLSSTSPSIVVDRATGKVDMVIGAAGGSRITTAVLEALVRTYHYDMGLVETIAFPRLHHQLLPETLFVENPAREQFVQGMMQLGHSVEMIDHATAMNGIRLQNDTITALSDYWRKLGQAACY
ncbi:hypothetical protein KL918_002685 [Ogataea parapolymorpha]|uniref:Glutathione hydrolase n=1 Tax=Ogataea parapolymorpha (strain ATCC 26012 / BCRC 20466 / JCM 22074 / NRRL Y-7560 / DL-1) TaxID=871575 RepID=W1QG28_OGAPD|nr:Gamma-glutamyltranspeptidase [Ogataea parapolymorpha DL-1]ESX01043.1 Gamma-glutamyltranspeptidase [Ogataea parapolymorpha DL-1]KAG7867246.1 hypothetical protein KL918_002685 [Ogataea parapolymorpha]KAG7870788.1 hypothetical protein KL916_004677 [Ogataea parapolymorpha]